MSNRETELAQRIQAFIEVIIHESRTNRKFARLLDQALAGNPDVGLSFQARSHRRNPPSLDPFSVYDDGESELRRALTCLGLEELKDIVAAYGMDRARLAMRWKTESRLVDLVVDTVKIRAHKGDVFRS